MNILLFSMPDSFEHMPTIAIRMPNGALTGRRDIVPGASRGSPPMQSTTIGRRPQRARTEIRNFVRLSR
jgi:hypothetical protein